MPALARCSLVAVLVSLAAGAVGQGRADDTAKKELARLEGTWVLVKMEIEGRSLLDKDRPWPKLVIVSRVASLVISLTVSLGARSSRWRRTCVSTSPS